MKLLGVVLALQVLLGMIVIVLVATDNVPFVDDDPEPPPTRSVSKVTKDRFDGAAAWRLLREQVELGPRPAGSRASRRLAGRLRELLPNGRYQPVPGGLRNVIGVVPGRSRATVVVGAHYDTKDMPGFVGADDGASGTAVAVELARSIRPGTLRPRVVFVLFDGEESPRGTPDSEFGERGLRGSKVAAPGLRDAEAMILLDFVGDRRLRIPYESNSDAELWERLRRAARTVGAAPAFPGGVQGSILDDHVPFIEQGVPSIDLIDFDFACFHRACDDLSAVSERSLDVTGETVYELLRTF
jgi:glutaminyl-peptide cyclotransferase